MKINMVLASIALVTGCSTNLFDPPFQDSAVHYNRVVADATNEQLLLNILRAKERQPMHFSAISSLGGSITVKGGGEVGITNPDSGLASTATSTSVDTVASGVNNVTETVSNGLNTVSSKIDASITSNPTFQYELLDTQEFYQGILKSVPADTIAHYLDQGWDPDFLAALLFEEIEVSTGKYDLGTTLETLPDLEHLQTIENITSGNTQGIQSFLHCFDIVAVPAGSKETVSLNFSADNVASFQGLSELITAGATISDNTITYKRPTSASFAIKYDQAKCEPKHYAPLLASSSGLQSKLTERGFISTDTADQIIKTIEEHLVLNISDAKTTSAGQEYYEADVKLKNSDKNAPAFHSVAATFHVKIRSPEGILYFLGEYLRSESPYKIPTKGGDQCLMMLSENTSRSAFASSRINHNFDGFHVPPKINDTDASSLSCVGKNNDVSNRNTYRVFRILSQLINLQKSSDARPATLVVRGVQ